MPTLVITPDMKGINEQAKKILVDRGIVGANYPVNIAGSLFFTLLLRAEDPRLLQPGGNAFDAATYAKYKTMYDKMMSQRNAFISALKKGGAAYAKDADIIDKLNENFDLKDAPLPPTIYRCAVLYGQDAENAMSANNLPAWITSAAAPTPALDAAAFAPATAGATVPHSEKPIFAEVYSEQSSNMSQPRKVLTFVSAPSGQMLIPKIGNDDNANEEAFYTSLRIAFKSEWSGMHFTPELMQQFQDNKKIREAFSTAVDRFFSDSEVIATQTQKQAQGQPPFKIFLPPELYDPNSPLTSNPEMQKFIVRESETPIITSPETTTVLPDAEDKPPEQPLRPVVTAEEEKKKEAEKEPEEEEKAEKEEEAEEEKEEEFTEPEEYRGPATEPFRKAKDSFIQKWNQQLLVSSSPTTNSHFRQVTDQKLNIILKNVEDAKLATQPLPQAVIKTIESKSKDIIDALNKFTKRLGQILKKYESSKNGPNPMPILDLWMGLDQELHTIEQLSEKLLDYAQKLAKDHAEEKEEVAEERELSLEDLSENERIQPLIERYNRIIEAKLHGDSVYRFHNLFDGRGGLLPILQNINELDVDANIDAAITALSHALDELERTIDSLDLDNRDDRLQVRGILERAFIVAANLLNKEVKEEEGEEEELKEEVKESKEAKEKELAPTPPSLAAAPASHASTARSSDVAVTRALATTPRQQGFDLKREAMALSRECKQAIDTKFSAQGNKELRDMFAKEIYLKLKRIFQALEKSNLPPETIINFFEKLRLIITNQAPNSGSLFKVIAYEGSTDNTALRDFTGTGMVETHYPPRLKTISQQLEALNAQIKKVGAAAQLHEEAVQEPDAAAEAKAAHKSNSAQASPPSASPND